MPETNQTADEVLDSLTGHEEIWIDEHFGKSVGELVQRFLEKNDVGPYYRALIFVLKRREGTADNDARNDVLEMKLSDVLEYFPRRSSEDPAEQEAVEESGKDEPEPQPEPQLSLSSVS